MVLLPKRTASDGGTGMFLRYTSLLAVAFLCGFSAALAYQFRGVEMHDQRPGLTVDWVNQKDPVILRYGLPSDENYEKAIKENLRLLRARILLDGATVVSFYEKPKNPYEFFDSTIVIERHGFATRTYNICDLIKDQALALVYVAFLRSVNGETMLVCNYEGGGTGAQQGFAILHFSSTDFSLSTLPLTLYGKVVVFKSKPWLVELWSAKSGLRAYPNSYATQSCQLKNEYYRCESPKKLRGLFVPNSIIDPGIQIRP
jgi:hypothetical protein